MNFHHICANHDREYLQNKITDPNAERACCHCLPSEKCGDDRSGLNESLKRVQYEQGQITEMMKKRYPEQYGIGQQELNMEKE